ncbi:MAG TPA: ABC transporter ATP-binding protein [Candidatus Saccharimonadales bacterium]|nr:ABC transporter ATP-binding protein [Candidatus Saccharimonadales bacterium]
MQSGDIAIDCQNLTKRYRGTKVDALHDLTIQVKAGEVYGFLGPNGAGKSTTIRTLLNFIQPTSGKAAIMGQDIIKDSVDIKRRIGYLSGDLAMYPKMTGAQFLEYMEDLLPAVSRAYRQELIKRFRAEPHKPLGELSRGNRQKIGIVQAFMHQPDVVILDEPTSGLDPLMQEEFYELLTESKQRGAAIFSSSHILGEVQKMCDRVGIIREGRLIAERSIAELASEASQTFDVIFKDAAPVSALKKIKGIELNSHHGNSVTLHIHGELKPLFVELARHDILKLDTQNLDLEEIFLRFYKQNGGWK